MTSAPAELEAVLLDHIDLDFTRASGWTCTCRATVAGAQVGPVSAVVEHAHHVAGAVRVWLTEALAAPEVVEAAARAISNLRPVYWESLNAKDGHRAKARRALAAAADVLRAGVTR